MIYFIKSGEYVKIGYTGRKINKRLRGLQTGNPIELELITTIHGGINVEKSYHTHFKDFKIRGEWYNYSGHLFDVIQKLAKGEQYIILNNYIAPKTKHKTIIKKSKKVKKPKKRNKIRKRKKINDVQKSRGEPSFVNIEYIKMMLDYIWGYIDVLCIKDSQILFSIILGMYEQGCKNPYLLKSDFSKLSGIMNYNTINKVISNLVETQIIKTTEEEHIGNRYEIVPNSIEGIVDIDHVSPSLDDLHMYNYLLQELNSGEKIIRNLRVPQIGVSTFIDKLNVTSQNIYYLMNKLENNRFIAKTNNNGEFGFTYTIDDNFLDALNERIDCRIKDVMVTCKVQNFNISMPQSIESLYNW